MAALARASAPRRSARAPRLRTRASAKPTARVDMGAINSLSVAITNSPVNKLKLWVARQQAGAGYDEAATAARVQSLVDGDDVVMFSFSTCPFCLKAKETLASEGVKFSAYELDQMGQEGYQLRHQLGVRTGRTSVPNIFIAGENIGGCNDGSPGLMPLLAEGGLEGKLAKCSLRFRAGRALARVGA
mmetsp:Transcript_8235/g.28894  ORF Transcript_8235/g.28894 Transcript_8235/m.28894 type:complete len:187 (+) Transcript_8235:50-610(+)